MGQSSIKLPANANAADPQSTLWVLRFPLLYKMNLALEWYWYIYIHLLPFSSPSFPFMSSGKDIKEI